MPDVSLDRSCDTSDESDDLPDLSGMKKVPTVTLVSLKNRVKKPAFFKSIDNDPQSTISPSDNMPHIFLLDRYS